MTRLGLGCARLGSAAAKSSGAAGIALVRHVMDRGVTFFDTADAYGNGTSERLLGKAVEGRRDEVTIATKGGYLFRERSALEARLRAVAVPIVQRVRGDQQTTHAAAAANAYAAQDFSPRHLRLAVEGSLRRLRTDRIDLYQLHGPHGVAPDDVASWAHGVVESGKVVRVGIGAETLDQIALWLKAVSSVQLPFGVLDPEGADAVIPQAMAAGVDVIARGVLGAGLLDARSTTEGLRARTTKWQLIEDLRTLAAEAGVQVVQLAVWYVRAQAGVRTLLVGTTSIRNADTAVDAMAASMPAPEVQAALADIVERHRSVQP